MVKLCWVRVESEYVLSYYYDFVSKKIYCIDMSEYDKGKLRFTPAMASLIVGPIVSGIGYFLKGKSFVGDSFIRIFIALLSICGVIVIHVLFERSRKVQDDYIQNTVEGIRESNEKLLSLMDKGKKYRLGIIFFIMLCCIFVVYSFEIINSQQPLIGVILFYIGIFGAEIWIKILSPLKLLKIKRMIKREGK